MFLSRVKAKGRYYFYIYIYDNQQENFKKSIYSLGEKNKALQVIEDWKANNKIPVELIKMGLKKEKIERWRKKIEEVS